MKVTVPEQDYTKCWKNVKLDKKVWLEIHHLYDPDFSFIRGYGLFITLIPGGQDLDCDQYKRHEAPPGVKVYNCGLAISERQLMARFAAIRNAFDVIEDDQLSTYLNDEDNQINLIKEAINDEQYRQSTPSNAS